MSAPAFEEADVCRGCGAGFGIFKRRHHCRNCGKSFCAPCTEQKIALKHFNLPNEERVCDPCYTLVKEGKATSGGTNGRAKTITKTSDASAAPAGAKAEGAAPAAVAQPARPKTNPFASYSSPAPKYDLNGDLDEQARDATKAGDTKGLEMLISKGAKPNYVDRQGQSLLHIAALFNHSDVAKLLLEKGANRALKNKDGETPADVASITLASTIRNFAAPA